MNRRLVYLDNSATGFPKPGGALARMVEIYRQTGASPGRGDYDLATQSEDLVTETRRRLAAFFGARDAERVVFAGNATDALNLAIQGIVGPGDHVVATRLEHNSVLRPLFHLKERGWIDYTLVSFYGDGFVDPDDMARAIRPNTRLVVVSHASNVLGTVQPVAAIARACAGHGVPLLVDAAQSAGHVGINMADWPLSIVAFTGHKALMGPTGIGGLAVSTEVDVRPTRFGGTGIESQSPVHTETYPHRLEAGTLNLLGIAGLSVGLEHIEEEGLARIHAREMSLFRRLREGLASLGRVRLYSRPPEDRLVPIIICNVAGLNPVDLAAILDGDYNIAVRPGLHCAPLVHADLGTSPEGAIRFSLGYSSTEEDIDAALQAMAEICGQGGS